MKNLVFLLFYCFLSGVVGAQAPPRQPLQIRELGGVNFSVNPLSLKPGQALIARNLDLSKMSLHQRDGFSFITDVKHNVEGLFSHIDRNGDKRLMSFAGPFPTEIGNSVLWSDPYKYIMGDTSYYEHYYEDVTPSWVTMNGVAVWANGKNRPQRFNGTNFRPLVPVPPGYLEVEPVSSSNATYVLDGDYYYATRITLPCDSTTYGPLFAISPQIHVDSDQVVFYIPNITAYTSICDAPANSKIQIGRTLAGATPLDTFWLIAHDTVRTTAVFIDSTPDASLGVNLGVIDNLQHPADTTADTYYKMGQPQWISTVWDTGAAAAGADGFVGMGAGWEDSAWVGTSYMVTYYDSSTGMESDSGPSNYIPAIHFDGVDKVFDSAIFISLSRPNTPNNHLWQIIYRAMVRLDSAKARVFGSLNEDIWPNTYINPNDDGSCPDGYAIVYLNDVPQCAYQYPWSSLFSVTQEFRFVDAYHAVDTIKNAIDTTYRDTTSWSTLLLREAWIPTRTIGQVNYPTIYNNRLYMARGSRIYYSNPGCMACFDIGSSFDVSPDDGDEVTGFVVTENGLRVLKNNSEWLVQWDNNLQIHIQTKLRDIGCVAPQSIITLPMGGYAYLSEFGVQVFSTHYQSLYKSSGGNFGDISRPIKVALDNYSIDDKRECHAWLTSDYEHLVFSFPTLDTSWVYALETGQWSAWDISTRQTTRYDTTYQTDLRPSNNVLGIGQTSDSVFKYGGVKTDTGKVIEIAWKSGPLFMNPVMDGVIDKFAFAKESNDTAEINVVFWSWRGDSLDLILDSTQFYFQKILTGLDDPQHGYQVEINTTGISVDSLTIYELNFWYRPYGEPGDK
jgi:hypothetical protein